MTAREIFDDALATIRNSPPSGHNAGEGPELPVFGLDWSPETLKIMFDDLAAVLAGKYAAEELSFDEGDELANVWFSQMCFCGKDAWSGLFYEVYIAFDAGEPRGEGATEQLAKDYTDPAIAEILASLQK